MDELKRLYWKTDSEKIIELLETLPTKYLIGRINKCKREIAEEKGEDRKERRIVAVNWKGYTFLASQETLLEELYQSYRKKEYYRIYNNDNPRDAYCWTYHYKSKEKHKKEKQVKRR